MATRYRLPEALGGMELPEDTGGRLEDDIWLLRFDIPGVGRIRIQKEALVEVKPPLPEEPPVGSVVRGGYLVFVRQDQNTEYRWMCPGSAAGYTWEQICVYGPPVRLVPDPFAEPVALPACGIHVERDRVCDGQARLTPGAARDKAIALMAAADAAEKEQS